MINLYRLSEAYKAVNIALNESDGELTPEIEALLCSCSELRDDKLRAIACLIKNATAEMKAYKEEENRLKIMRQSAEKRIERLEAIALMVLPAGESWTDGTHKLSYRESKAVEVINETELPPFVLREKHIVEPDKIAIKKALESGETIPGAVLVSRQSLQVK